MDLTIIKFRNLLFLAMRLGVVLQCVQNSWMKLHYYFASYRALKRIKPLIQLKLLVFSLFQQVLPVSLLPILDFMLAVLLTQLIPFISTFLLIQHKVQSPLHRGVLIFMIKKLQPVVRHLLACLYPSLLVFILLSLLEPLRFLTQVPHQGHILPIRMQTL